MRGGMVPRDLNYQWLLGRSAWISLHHLLIFGRKIYLLKTFGILGNDWVGPPVHWRYVYLFKKGFSDCSIPKHK